MKKIIIKIISILLTAAFLLSGCVEKDAKSLEPWEKNNQEKNNSLKFVNLTFCFTQKQPVRFNEEWKELQKKAGEYLHVKLNAFFIPQNYAETVKQRMEAGERADIIFLNQSNVESFLEKDLLKDITQLFPKNAPDYYASYRKELLKSLNYNGEQIGIPPNKKPTYYKYRVLARSDLLKKYRMTSINNLGDLNDFLRLVKQNDTDLTPLLASFNTIDFSANANDYIIFDENQEFVYKRNDPQMKLIPWEQTSAYKDAINRLFYWDNCGYLDKEKMLSETESYTTADGIHSVGFSGSRELSSKVDINIDKALLSGNYAAIITHEDPDYIDCCNNRIKEAGGEPYSVFDISSSKKTQCYYLSNIENFLAFNKKSPNIDRAIMFLEWLHSDIEYYRLFMYGIKGKDYKMDKDNHLEILDYTDPYMSWSDLFPFQSVYENALNQSGYLKKLKKEDRKINSMTVFPQHLGFYSDINELLSRLKLNPERQSGYLENKIYDGKYESMDLDNYINSQKVTAEALVTELQSQLDRWRVNNK